QVLARMLDGLAPRDVADVDKAVNALFELVEPAEVRQVTQSPVDARSDLLAFAQGVPRVRLHLLQTETDAARARVNAEHFSFDRVADVDQFPRMLRPLRPTHFGDVHETFHARFKLNECAVVGHARNRAFDARADDE